MTLLNQIEHIQEHAILDAVNRLELTLAEFIRSQGGWLFFDVTKEHIFSHYPVVHMMNNMNMDIPGRIRSIAEEYVVYAATVSAGDILLYAEKVTKPTNKVYSKEEILSSFKRLCEEDNNDGRWFDCTYDNEPIYYITISQICDFLVWNKRNFTTLDQP